MQKKRMQVLERVLELQNKQRQEGMKDPEALREASCEASAWAKDRALEYGRKDAKAAEAVLGGNHEVAIACGPRSETTKSQIHLEEGR